jgi:hypothetical protein
VAFVLARLYEETGNSRFLDAARQGALHLQKIATVRGRGALISYRYPDLADVYYPGFCHGPAGSRLSRYDCLGATKNEHGAAFLRATVASPAIHAIQLSADS